MPEWTNLRSARNITLVPSKKFGYKHKGITLPAILGDLGKKYFNVQHRFNEFQFHVPITSYDIPGILQEQFIFLKGMKAYSNIKFTHVMPLASSLNIL